MNLLQQLINTIKVGAGITPVPMPHGGQLSPAVQAKNNTPPHNEYNALGQPIQPQSRVI